VAASGRKWPQVAASGSIFLSPAATCSHLQPLEWPQVAASGRQHSLVTGSHLQPLAATRVAASGRKWPPAFSFHRQPLAATCSQSSGRKWPQVAASGRKWLPEQVAASGRLCQNQIRALLYALCNAFSSLIFSLLLFLFSIFLPHLCFLSINIVGNLTSKFPSIIYNIKK